MRAARIEIDGHEIWMRKAKGDKSFVITSDEFFKTWLRDLEISFPEDVSILCDEGDGELLALMNKARVCYGYKCDPDAKENSYSIDFVRGVRE